MTAAVSHIPEPYEVPDGGLASFLTATVGDWSDEALNADNYYDIVKPTADQLAAFGREEDDRIAHVATGETVIPMAVFEEDPALKEALFARMREMGIDPERYVVGNELNSINPVTGQPEFFLKKIFKGIKKAVKGVVKVFKKIAPIVLSIGGAALFGPLGAALGSGIGTLIQGGNLKDAFKSALLSGVTAGVTQGITQGFESAGALGEGATFGEKLSAGLEGFGQSIGEGLGLVEGTSYLDQLGSAQGILNPTGREVPAEIVDKSVAVERVIPPEGMTPAQIKANAVAKTAADAVKPAVEPVSNFFSPEGPAGALSQSANTAADIAAQEAAKLKAQGIATGTSNTNLTAGLTPPGAPSYATPGASAKTIAQNSLERAAQQQATGAPSPAGGPNYVDAAGNITAAGESFVRSNLNTKGFFESMRDFISNPSFESLKQAFVPDKLTAEKIQDLIKNSGAVNADEFTIQAGQSLADAFTKAGVNPGIMRSYAPMLITGALVAEPLGFFDPPEMGELPDYFGGTTGSDLLRMYPQKYGLPAPGSGYKPLGAAKGGDIQSFPRKNGPIYGPGTETSDDIPAMLSDGEFVMTAKAVRGAGNGSRQAGMRKMYDMMRTFEGGV